MAQLESHKDEILNRGSLVFIAAQKRGNLLLNAEKFLVKNPISFPFLLDEDRSVTKSYGLYTALSFDSIMIAHPATLVIDRFERITYLYVGSNQLDRAPIADVLEAFGAAADAPGIHQT